MAKERISFLKVPLDILQEEDFYNEIQALSQKEELSQICFVTIWDILRARRSQEYLSCLQNAALVLPISPSILRGCKFLNLPMPVRYNQFKAVINIMNVLDKNFRTIYLLGGRKEVLASVEKNVHDTFPGLHIVGRCTGYYQKNFEPDIIEAVYKACPTLMLMSNGVQGGDLWTYRKKDNFKKGIFLYYKDCFGVFSKRKKRVSDKTFKKGTEMLAEICKNPFKIFMIFPYLWYLILLLVYKGKGK